MTAYIHGLVPESWPHPLVTLTEKPPRLRHTRDKVATLALWPSLSAVACLVSM